MWSNSSPITTTGSHRAGHEIRQDEEPCHVRLIIGEKDQSSYLPSGRRTDRMALLYFLVLK